MYNYTGGSGPVHRKEGSTALGCTGASTQWKRSSPRKHNPLLLRVSEKLGVATDCVFLVRTAFIVYMFNYVGGTSQIHVMDTVSTTTLPVMIDTNSRK